MEIRIDDAYGKVYFKEDGDDDFYFYSSFFALGITSEMSEDDQKQIINEEYYNS